MAQKKTGLAGKMEAINHRLYTRVRKNQEILDNAGAEALFVEAAERLKVFFKIK